MAVCFGISSSLHISLFAKHSPFLKQHTIRTFSQFKSTNTYKFSFKINSRYSTARNQRLVLSTLKSNHSKMEEIHNVSFIGAEKAQIVDDKLMSQLIGFELSQLMELAGLSVAQAVHDFYKDSSRRSIVVCCGPGNNGGDGLVAARHLFHFGYSINSVIYPRLATSFEKPLKPFYSQLISQLSALDIPLTSEPQVPQDAEIIIDSLFGFSFSSKGGIRSPYDIILSTMNQAQRKHNASVVAVDVPSGWHVETGPDPNADSNAQANTPDMLISLTCPKLGVRDYTGPHYIGGRFVPPKLLQEMDLKLPKYNGSDQIVRLV
mmetsp:Transcript_9921/g.17871  ORF Transcript_9921/g.17871 Transcript_9921/m.17871 type:complete len:319 (-) Transcript_9921:62-1018(-)